jgi:membrane-bound metal-dependent hydrolase YbcI (DUF457 family)
MPSPIAHLGTGYAVYRYFKRNLPENRRQLRKLPVQMLLIMGLSMLPDLDIIPAIIFRDMKNYHNNFSHSLLLGIPVAIVIAAILYQIYHTSFWQWFLICLVSYDLHIIMDTLTAERGVMLFWPLTQHRFASPIKIFYGLQWGLGWFSIWHIWTMFTELLFTVAVICAVNYFDKRRNNVNTVISSGN